VNTDRCPFGGIWRWFSGVQSGWFSFCGQESSDPWRYWRMDYLGILSKPADLAGIKLMRRSSIDVSVPTWVCMVFGCQSIPVGWGKVIIWLSDSPNWVWKVCDVLSDLIRTHGASHAGCTLWAGELASTCKAFDVWLCNPRVSGRGASGLGRPSGRGWGNSRITAMEKTSSEGAGGVSENYILQNNAGHD